MCLLRISSFPSSSLLIFPAHPLHLLSYVILHYFFLFSHGSLEGDTTATNLVRPSLRVPTPLQIIMFTPITYRAKEDRTLIQEAG